VVLNDRPAQAKRLSKGNYQNKITAVLLRRGDVTGTGLGTAVSSPDPSKLALAGQRARLPEGDGEAGWA